MQSLDCDESVNVVQELESRGIVHFRWGGDPICERELPDLGDDEVLLRRQKGKVMMLLMKSARQDFDAKLKSAVFPRQNDKELIELMKRPIGL